MELPEPSVLDRLADRGWPALERQELEGWTLRASSGVTNRANSVLTAGPVADVGRAVRAAEDWYGSRDLPAVFQVSPASPAALADELRARGYRPHSQTDILVAEANTVAAFDEPRVDGPTRDGVTLEDAPRPGWLDTWWSVDGRGGDAERSIVERILLGGPALYAADGDGDGDAGSPAAVARLALVGEWGGLFAVATRPAARRSGRARRLILALAAAGASRGVRRLWLQVLAENAAAAALYRSLGFERASHYCYWIAPS
ncbi:MAG: GNAT family N-acetyltransferase [Leifsonia sp.]